MPLCPPFGSAQRQTIFWFRVTLQFVGAGSLRKLQVPSGPAACGHPRLFAVSAAVSARQQHDKAPAKIDAR